MTSIGFNEDVDSKSYSTGLIKRGFRPELYTVVNGSYVSNSAYGSSAALVNSYNNIQLPRGGTTIPLVGPSFVTSTTGCDIRQEGREVEFSCSVTINGATDPGFVITELRIRPTQADVTQPGRQKVTWPIPSRTMAQPIFNDVEIKNKAGVRIAPDAGVGTWELQARLLSTGVLALVLHDQATNTSRAIQASDFNASYAANQAIFFNIRGRYLAESPVVAGGL